MTIGLQDFYTELFETAYKLNFQIYELPSGSLKQNKKELLNFPSVLYMHG